jgi:ATP-dependent Zn protease
MSDRLGSLVLSPPDDDGGSLLPLRHSEALVAEADGEVRRLLEEAEGLARMILTTNHAALLELADALVKSETVEGEELRSILDRVIHPGRADVTLEGASGTLRTGPPVDAESI